MKNLHNSKNAVLLRTKSEKQQKMWQYAYELQIWRGSGDRYLIHFDGWKRHRKNFRWRFVSQIPTYTSSCWPSESFRTGCCWPQRVWCLENFFTLKVSMIAAGLGSVSHPISMKNNVSQTTFTPDFPSYIFFMISIAICLSSFDTDPSKSQKSSSQLSSEDDPSRLSSASSLW